jgi:transposase-like protein
MHNNYMKEVMLLNLQRTAAKRKKTHRRSFAHQRLPCPACHFERLIDTGQHIRSLTFIEGQEGYLDADYYAKCPNPKCKAEIGIRKIE